MKKLGFFTLLLVAALAITACGGPATFDEVDVDKYVTLGEYKGLSYTPADTTVSDYELNVALNEKLSDSGYATYTEDANITEGTVQLGDTVNIDYAGTKDGVAFQGGTASGQSLTIGSGQFIDGFEEGLVGKEIGSTVSLDLTFPENYGNEELNGAAVVFEVTINSVTERVTYGELTDSLANTINSEVQTADEFIAAVKSELEAEKKSDAESDAKSTLWNAAIGNVTFAEKLPEKLLESSTNEFIEYYTAAASQNGYDDLEEFVTAQGVTMDSFNEQADAYGLSMVQSQLTAYAIAKAEGYAVTDDIITETATTYAAQYGYSTADDYIEAVGKDAVRDQAVLDYAVELVVSSAVANT